MTEDYYKTLGLSRSASAEEIRKAYRELARKYHPDLHPDDAAAKQKFQEVQNAFDVLNDDKKKAMYDRYGPDFENLGGSGGQRGAWSGRSSSGGQEFQFDFEDLFGGAQPQGGAGGGFADFFRQFSQPGQKGSQPRGRGRDIEHELTVPFATAIQGGQAQISLHRPSGKIEDIAVKIPVGIEDGKKIRLRGQGEAAGGQNGDLLITVRVSPHPTYRRQGKRLLLTVPITLEEAMLGAKIDVPSPSGTITLSVPPGTSSGKKLRVKGQGVAPKGQEPGDLLAEIQIVLPPNLTEEQRKQIAEIVAGQPPNPRAELRW